MVLYLILFLQMIGRAGRPQFDRHGVAVVMVHEPKKQFYKRFLYDPFPVESSLPNQVSLQCLQSVPK
jgi:activating signal cointegrator complex subunit 3